MFCLGFIVFRKYTFSNARTGDALYTTPFLVHLVHLYYYLAIGVNKECNKVNNSPKG
jgi:hypothetical protein